MNGQEDHCSTKQGEDLANGFPSHEGFGVPFPGAAGSPVPVGWHLEPLTAECGYQPWARADLRGSKGRAAPQHRSTPHAVL